MAIFLHFNFLPCILIYTIGQLYILRERKNPTEKKYLQIEIEAHPTQSLMLRLDCGNQGRNGMKKIVFG